MNGEEKGAKSLFFASHAWTPHLLSLENEMKSSPLLDKSSNICVKCRSCGLPWNRELQRRKRQNQRKRDHVHFQLCSVIIQSYVRRYLIQRHRRNNDPIEQWNRRCVHYLTTKGPYGARTYFDAYQRIGIYRAAAIELQKVWRLHQCLKYLQNLSPSDKQLKATLIQRIWRSSWCRRSFRTVFRAIRQREKLFYSLIDSGAAETVDKISFCLSGCPFDIEYKQQSSEAWTKADCIKFRSYIHQQLTAQYKRRRISNRRRTTILNNPTTRKSGAELKYGKIHRMSQKKWKWFYNKHDCCDTRKPEVADSSSDAEVMEWLTSLDLDDGCCMDN